MVFAMHNPYEQAGEKQGEKRKSAQDDGGNAQKKAKKAPSAASLVPKIATLVARHCMRTLRAGLAGYSWKVPHGLHPTDPFEAGFCSWRLVDRNGARQ